MNEDRMIMFRNRLEKVYRHLGKQARRLGITCYRIYDHDLPEFPFCIEIYEKNLYVAEYQRRHGMTDGSHETWIASCLAVIAEIFGCPGENIFLRLRKKKQGRQGQYRKQDNSGSEFIVQENGLKFIVNLSDYLDTGLFLDHRITRQLIRERSKDKMVLNLFAYTGSFSVYAAAGGAREVVTVDLSKNYLDWAQRNLALNGFTAQEKYQFIQSDIKQWLGSITPDYYDLVILDPPTFSNSKKMDEFLDIQRDHVVLINQSLAGLKKGGELFFSTNYKKFELELDKLNVTGARDITKTTTAFDFAGRLDRKCFLMTK